MAQCYGFVVQGSDLQHLCQAYKKEYNAVIRDVCYDLLFVVNQIFSFMSCQITFMRMHRGLL